MTMNNMFLSALILAFGVTGYAQGPKPSAKKVVDLAQKLQAVAQDLEKIADMKGYPNTEQHLEDIDNLAEDVEKATRQLDLVSAQDSMNDLVDVAIDMRKFVANIPDMADKLRIKRKIARAINDLGGELFKGKWIPMTCPAPASVPGQPVPVLDCDEFHFDTLKPVNKTGSEFTNDLGTEGGGGDFTP